MYDKTHYNKKQQQKKKRCEQQRILLLKTGLTKLPDCILTVYLIKSFKNLEPKLYTLFVSVTNEDNVFSLISLVFMMHGVQESPAHCTSAPLTLTVRKAMKEKKKKNSALLVRWQI